MHSNNSSNRAATRIQILNEMGLGPVWLPRYTNTDVPEVSGSPTLQNAHPANVDVLSQDAASTFRSQMQNISTDIAAASPSLTTDDAAVANSLYSETSIDSQKQNRVSALNWAELEQVVASCHACGLCRGRQQAVFGIGVQTAVWLFVGEGPGYHEDLQGEPFVGAAGQLLDNMLLALGVRRNDRAYIANVVKCRATDDAGNDRSPTADEIANCLPYLHRQISLIQPQVIVALGKTAAIALSGIDPETPVAQLRGKVHRIGDVPMVATYHPAYLLRKPLEKAKAWQDLCLARDALDGKL